MDAAGFARRAAQIRNIYAHSLENEQPELDELIVFTYQLKALMEALLLHESGFKARVIDEKLLETQRYRHIREMRGKR